MPDSTAELLVYGSVGLAGGLVLLVRGMRAYRDAAHVTSVATSRLNAIAAGEVRVTGTVAPLAMTLVSPLQSTPCVWYRASITESDNADTVLFSQERSIEFMLRDATGEVRVIPRGGRWEIDPIFSDSTDWMGTAPAGLQRNGGPEYASVPEIDRDTAVAQLLSVRPAPGLPTEHRGSAGKRYTEARVEPGQVVTVLCMALPHGDVSGPVLPDDSTAADDVAAAREAGLLRSTPEEA